MTGNGNERCGPGSPARLFGWLRWHLVRNSLREMFSRSSVRPVTIVMCSLVVWAFVFAISCAGFHFLKHEQQFDLGGGIISILFDLLFLALGVLLILSSGLILYSSLFASRETTFLLASPAPEDHIFAYMFIGALAFSSWAFLLLGGPILIAFGITYPAPWPYYVLLPLFILGFVLLPGSLGALACLFLVNFLPQRRKQLVVLTVILLAGLAGLIAYRTLSSLREEVLTPDAVQRLFGPFELAQASLLPSHWIAWGMRASARGQTGTALLYLALVWSNGLLAYIFTAWLAKHLYRRGCNRLTTGGDLKRRPGGHWLDTGLEKLLFPLSPQLRLLIVKDFRTFRRDPAQWAQIVLFCALLTLYFVNVRKLFVRDITWAHQNGISLLNLSATSLLLCTYTGRFIYPMLSLEGRKFWVLGLLPLEREKLLWGKFYFSATGAVLISLTLVLISDAMLEMPWPIVLLHALTAIVLATGLSGLSVGLGACMPSFREADPSKIAAGFGGTLNLVIGLGYLIVILVLMAGPWHAFAAAEDGEVTSTLGLAVTAVGAVTGLVAGAVAVMIPLTFGARQLRQTEF